MSGRARRSVVVDASAVAAVLFAEPEGDEVAARVDKCGLVAPTLLPYEVGSVALKKLRKRPAQGATIRRALRLLPRLEVRRVEVPPQEALDLAEKEGLSAYDASYLWLARMLECELVTLDQRLDSAARG